MVHHDNSGVGIGIYIGKPIVGVVDRFPKCSFLFAVMIQYFIRNTGTVKQLVKFRIGDNAEEECGDIFIGVTQVFQHVQIIRTQEKSSDMKVFSLDLNAVANGNIIGMRIASR